jgi:hypothetical protein
MNLKAFDEWASAVYENKHYTLEASNEFFNQGDADPRSIFECLIFSIDENLNESLTTLEFDFNEIDTCLVEGITDSINFGNDEVLDEAFDFIKTRVKDTIDKAGEFINKGVQIGADLYTSVKDISAKLKDVIGKLFEKIKKFLGLAFDYSKKTGKDIIQKVKTFVKEEAKGTAISSVGTILAQKSTDIEIQEAQKDAVGAVNKVSGKNYNLDANKATEKLKEPTQELEDVDDKEIEDVLIDDLTTVKESTVFNIVTTIKGALIEGYTLDEMLSFSDQDENVSEEHSNQKGLMGWMIEALGFALSPFAKLYEFLIKASTNGIWMVVSSVARGGIKNAYKYVMIGTLVSLCYHIAHGIMNINQHFSGEHGAGATHESSASDIKIAGNKQLIDLDKATNILKPVLGAIFVKALSTFFPMVSLVMEMVLISIASFELMIGYCEFKGEKEGVCKTVMDVEHKLASLFG